MRTPKQIFVSIVLLAWATQQLACGAVAVRDHLSPRNGERPKRKSTQYIILHTTEGSAVGSLNKLHQNGEAHYLIDLGGQIYRIIDKSRVAYHAGRSMWNGTRNIDDVSIGIEMAGYHNQSLSSSQIAALRALLMELKQIYKIPDERVLPHSMVAYGSPNRWHRRSHRGRKRCGMQMANTTLRRKLGLYSKPALDPDVRAGRLVIGDAFLHDMLFKNATSAAPPPVNVSSSSSSSGSSSSSPDTGGQLVIVEGMSAWDVAREQYNSSRTKYIFPDGTTQYGNQITNWKRVPTGTRIIIDSSEPENAEDAVVTLEQGASNIAEIAGDEQTGPDTIYFLTDGRVRTGAELGTNGVARLEAGTRVLMGYVVGGYISRSRSAYDVCGEKWNAPSTIYRFPDGSIHYGSKVKEGGIPRSTQVFFRN